MAGERDPLRSDLGATGPPPALYALSTVVYAERGGQILLLQRGEGSAMAGQWFLPGGMVEPGELPEDGARRELREESGLEIEGELEMIGCYPMHVYGWDTIQLSYRGTVAGGSDAIVSHEHDGARWVRASEMMGVLTDDAIQAISAGDERVSSLLRHIRTDLQSYLKRTS